ncbi:NRPS-like enzyme [Penicillium odoratum]|uniref:NRPS-like enzyme n=1 Tax=Penicillium odoratum TaxID=1167516 RepID=UPI0025498F75|nr:NRPS-like enzyme [Penicillium odoratum]KAJ5745425.1 NRPS-like enzyme [Penicillium odoratum]
MGSTAAEGRVLTQVLDDLAQKSPDSLWCIHPVSQDDKYEWRHISFQQFAQAVDRLAWWIDQKLDGQRNPKVLAYIGTNDLRYAAFILALLDELVTACSDLPLERWNIDPMWKVFASDPVPHYPHDVHYADVEDVTITIIHSSGTTGNPKPVRLTHGYYAFFDNLRSFPVPPGRQIGQMYLYRQGELRFFNNPMFHVMGILSITECLFFETPFLFAPDRPLTPSLFAHIMNQDYHPTWGLFTPYNLETLAASEEGLGALKKLSAVNFAGAPMAQATGDKLSSIFRVQSIIGSSETGYTPTLLCEDPADWGYLEWIPEYDLRMEEVGDGLRELILERPNTRRHHPIFHTHPHLAEYRTGDLFRPHPSKPGLWRYEGRGDDIIVLSNGEKFNPIEAEKLVESHHLVKFAAVFGKDRFQSSLLIEPDWEKLPSNWTPDWLKKTLLPLIEQANALLPGHGKIFESHITFASRDKPFSLSPKGTLRRRVIAKTYDAVLDGLYSSKFVVARPAKKAKEVPGLSLPEIQQWVQEQVAGIMACDIIDLEDDLATLGIDSLQVVRLTQILQSAEQKLPQVQKPIAWTSAMIYDLATISRVTHTLYKHIHGRDPETTTEKTPFWSREASLTKLIWQQAQFLGAGGLTVALTGSTGELGSFLLGSLLQDPTVHQIYCLNRSSDAAERQVASFEKKKLCSAWLTETSRVQFWLSSLHEENLGLTLDKYNFLEKNIDVLIHNAWPVNFNQPIANFEPQIIGVRRLLTLIEHSSRDADFHFVSSVSTILGKSVKPHSFISESLQEMSAALQQGYGESKFVGEALCGISSHRKGSRIAIHRVGQLGGPSNPDAGMWNVRDWVPALVRSSKTMQKLPNSLGPFQVNWLPIDIAARIMTEIVQSRREKATPDLTIYHIINRQTTDWKALAATVAKACDASIVPLNEWVQALEQLVASEDTDLTGLPAASLLDFFRMLAKQQNSPKPTLDHQNSRRDSEQLRALGPVDDQLMRVWLRQWKEWIPGLVI